MLSPAIVAQIQNAVRVSPNISLRALAVACGVSVESVHKALRKNLHLRKCPCRWVPHLLTNAQKQRRLQVSRHNLRAIQRNPALLTRIITGDESWFLIYDPAQKQQMKVWMADGATRPAKVRRDDRCVKAMLVLFFDVRGVVSRQFVPRGQGVNTDEYMRHLRTLRTNVRHQRPQLHHRNNWLLHHDGAPAHRADPVLNFFMQHDIELWP